MSAPRPSCGSTPSASGLSPGVTAVSRGGGSCSDSAIPAPRPPPQHFVCAKCEKPFLGHRHYEKKGLAYCETHYNQVRLEAGQWDAVLRGASQGGLAGKGMGQPPPLGAPWRVLSGGCAAGLCAECLGNVTTTAESPCSSNNRPVSHHRHPQLWSSFDSSPPTSLELLQSHYGDVSRSPVTERQGQTGPQEQPAPCLCAQERRQPAVSAGGRPSPSEGTPVLASRVRLLPIRRL